MANPVSYSNWMAGLSGDTNLASLALPGTNNSGANYISLENDIDIALILRPSVPDLPWGLDEKLLNALGKLNPLIDAVVGLYALNQESTISEQLSNGVRYLDIHFDYDQANDKMVIANGPVKYKELDLAMQEIEAWLAANPSETILLRPELHEGHSEALMKRYFHNRYVYKTQVAPRQEPRTFTADELARNPFADDHAKQTPLIGESIFWLGDRLPSLGEARGKVILLDADTTESLKQSDLWGTEQDAGDTSSLPGGIQEKIDLIRNAILDIAKDDPSKLVQNHFQLSPGAPRYGEILPSSLSGWYKLAKQAINSPDELLALLVKQVFTPLTPPIGLAAQLNSAALELLKDLPPEQRTRGLWVGDFTDGSSDFVDQGLAAITNFLSLPEDTSKLSAAEKIKVNLLLSITEQLRQTGTLQAADVTPEILRQNLGAVVSFSNKSIKEGGSTELRINWFDPAISTVFFELTPSSPGAATDDLLIGSGDQSTSGYVVLEDTKAWRGNVAKGASGYLTIYGLDNQDTEETAESFSLQLYRDESRQQKIGEAVSFTLTPGAGGGGSSSAQTAYTITTEIANAPWAGSGDEGSPAMRSPSSIRLIIEGLDHNGNPISANVELSAGIYNRAINGNRTLPFQRGASDRFNVLLDERFETISSASVQASNADKDFIDLKSLAINRVNPLRDTLPGRQAERLFAVDFERDAVKVESQKEDGPWSQYLYKTGLTKDGAYRINSTQTTSFEVLPYLGGSNDKIATSKGDVWFHVLDQNGERTPTSETTLNLDLPTFIITHGFTGGSGDNWLAGKLPNFSTTAPDWRLNDNDLLQWEAFYGDDHALGLSVQEAYRDQEGNIQANVVLADWGNFSAIGSGPASYASYAVVAEEHVPAAGRALADYIKKQGIDPGKVTLLGHSLGGHVVGFAGQSVQDDVKLNPLAYVGKGQEVATIVAMDPAGPMFETWAPHKRLSNGDAGQVIAIHTDSLMGFDAPLGSHDLYMNAYYGVAHNSPGISAEDFQTALKAIYDTAETIYSDVNEQLAYATYLASGLLLTWDPAFTWYLLKTEENPEDGRQWFQKQHNYSMATLANLFLEDKRLNDPDFVLPFWLGGSDPSISNSNIKDPTASGWTQTFKRQLDDFRARNDAIAKEGQIPATFSTLIAGNGEGGLFSGMQPLQWSSGESSSQDWQDFPYTFLKPDSKFQGDVTIPFSDYAYFWNDTGSDLATLAIEEISKLLTGEKNTISQVISGIETIGDINLSYISNWGGLDFYNRFLSPDFGFADGSGISLGGTSIPDIGGAALLSKVSEIYTTGYNTYNTISSWINTVYGLKQKVFGGPVVNGEVVLDLRTYNASGTTLSQNLNLSSDSGEASTTTDATGSFSLGNLPASNTIGNRDGILDYRDGLVIAGIRDINGSISVLDSISGSNYGFPLVGLPGGNITLLTTLKYATLLRWTPASSLLGQELSPDLITQLFAQIIKDAPRAFLDDSFNPYAAISSSDPVERQAGVDSLAFAYEHLAVIKLITQLLKPSTGTSNSSDAGGFGLIYGANSPEDLALWGRDSSDPLDPTGVDRAELVAFTAYGLAIQQSFTAERPFDPGDAEHLRDVLVNLLSNYPTEAILGSQNEAFKQQFALAQKPEGSIDRDAARAAVRDAIEEQLGTTLTNLSNGLSIINSVLQERFRDAAELSGAIPAVGTQLLIPTLAGPKRFMADTLSKELVTLAQQEQNSAEFRQAFEALLFTPLTIDDPQRVATFKLALTTGDGQSVGAINPNDPIARFSMSITDADGNPQPAPDYGLAVRFRLGGNAVEGVDYAVGDNLQHRLLSFAPGASEATIELPINPQALLRGNAVLQLELLSADSGYGVDANQAVASVVIGPRASQAENLTGQRTAFVPHALITSEANQDAVLTAAPDQKNAILRGQDGRKDSFVIGGLYQGLPHIENFNPSDGDQVLIDAAVWADNTEISLSRNELGQVVNTYAGYVFDLLSGRPLALISQYDPTTGDQAWTGLSSDQRAPYFDLAPAGKSAGVAIAGRSFVRGSAAEIALASNINSLLNTDAALELVAINRNGQRQVVMTLPGVGAGLPDGFEGHQRQTGFIGRINDNTDEYSFALRNLATGQFTPLRAEKPSPSEQTSKNTAFILRNEQGSLIATVSTFSEADGSKPQQFTEELVHPAFGADPVIGISLSSLGTALNDTSRVLRVQLDVFREAAFDNRVGLYLADRQTLAPLDAVTGVPISQSASEALRQPGSIAAWLGDAVAKGASQIEATIAIPDAADANTIALLPYLVAGDSSQTVMLPASTLNPDQGSHLRLLGLNTFGFEDRFGPGSDWDYDDVIAKVSGIELTTTSVPMA
jgi:pimeloyl-ACP methyl ester carboxylesterase